MNRIIINKNYELNYDDEYKEIILNSIQDPERRWEIITEFNINQEEISELYDHQVKELKEIDHILIKYIIKIDELNKENKLKKKDIKEIYNNLKYIIKNNKNKN